MLTDKQKKLERNKRLRERRAKDPLLRKINRFKERKNYSNFVRKRMSDTKYGKVTLGRIVHVKHNHFAETRTKAERKEHGDRVVKMFKNSDLKEKLQNDPHCYLTGDKIDLMDSSSYSLDHKIPKSKGGDSSIDNCGLTTFMANQMKSNQTIDELLENCMKIIIYNKEKINISELIKVLT